MSTSPPPKRRFVRPRRQSMVLALCSALVLVVAACGGDDGDDAGSSDTSESSGSSAPTSETLNIGIVVEATGPYAPVFEPAVDGAEAAINEINDAGGVNGYQLSLEVYDSASSPSGGDAAVRRAVNDDVFALLSVSQYIDGALPLLNEEGIPVVGFGVSPNWYGADKTNLFSYTGDIINYTSDAIVRTPVDEGRNKLGLVSDPSPGAKAGAETWAKMIETVDGAELVFENYDLSPTDVAGINSIAQQAIDSDAEAILTTNPVGTAQLQVAIAQLGGDIQCFTASEYGGAVAEQFGQAADGLTAMQWYATLQHDTQGAESFRSSMEAIGAEDNINQAFAPQGYIQAKVLAEGVAAITGEVTSAALVETMNADFTTSDLGGLIKPATWPKAHDQLVGGWSFSELRDGEWTAYGDGTFPPGEVFP